MKNKARRQFTNSYKWWDYCYLLYAIRDWCNHSSKMTLKHGICLKGPSVARKMRIAAILCDRIINDDYSSTKIIWNDQTDVLGKPDRKQIKRIVDYEQWQKQRDLNYLMDLMKNDLFNWWD